MKLFISLSKEDVGDKARLVGPIAGSNKRPYFLRLAKEGKKAYLKRHPKSKYHKLPLGSDDKAKVIDEKVVGKRTKKPAVKKPVAKKPVVKKPVVKKRKDVPKKGEKQEKESEYSKKLKDKLGDKDKKDKDLKKGKKGKGKDKGKKLTKEEKKRKKEREARKIAKGMKGFMRGALDNVKDIREDIVRSAKKDISNTGSYLKNKALGKKVTKAQEASAKNVATAIIASALLIGIGVSLAVGIGPMAKFLTEEFFHHRNLVSRSSDTPIEDDGITDFIKDILTFVKNVDPEWLEEQILAKA